MHDYAGSIHFHSDHSYDARIPVSEILTSASRSQLDFAILTDHFRQEQKGGYFSTPGQAKPVLLIVGEEISPRYNHYLAFDLKTPIVVWKSETNAQRYIDAVNAQGGFGFISHPDHAGAPLFGSRAYPWIQWDVHGFSGLGLWDLMSDWNTSLATPWGTLRACMNPAKALKGPSPKTIERWDALCQKGPCVVIGEIDNHAHQKSFFSFRREVFPFDFAFRTIRTHVLLEEPLSGEAPADEMRILAAVKKGQSYVSLDYWTDPTGFSFTVYHEHARALPGGRIARQGQTILEAKLPCPGKLRLIRDGRVVREEAKRMALQWDADLAGVYRIEAQQYAAGQWRPWIYSNPIWVQ